MKDNYNWKYASVGGSVRVKLERGSDIANLASLDRKKWTVLSCPTTGLEFDEKTLMSFVRGEKPSSPRA